MPAASWSSQPQVSAPLYVDLPTGLLGLLPCGWIPRSLGGIYKALQVT